MADPGAEVGFRLLIAVGEAASSPQDLPPTVRTLIDAAGEVLVIAPSLPSRLDWLTSDTDKARHQADERLHEVLGHLDELGVPARGEVGADDPVLAFDDAIREFHPDHVVIGLRPVDHAGWQEMGLLDQVVQRFRLPVTVFEPSE